MTEIRTKVDEAALTAAMKSLSAKSEKTPPQISKEPVSEVPAAPLPKDTAALEQKETAADHSPVPTSRTLVRPSRWAAAGFIGGIILWSFVSIWHDVDDPVVSLSSTTPSEVDLALRDKAVSSLADETTQKDQATIPIDLKVSKQEKAKRCVVVELDREENLIKKKPCKPEENGWAATNSQTITAENF